MFDLRRSAVLIGLLVGACPQVDPPAPAEAPEGPGVQARLQLLAAGDVGSDTDVCGCKAKQLGGLGRRGYAVEARKTAFDGPTVVVDAGDLFFRRWSIPVRYQAQALRTAQLHADAMRRWGAAAMAVGERDLALGLSTLRRLGRRGEVPLLSANLVHAETGTAAFAGHVVVSVDGVRVGFVGASPVLTEDHPAMQVYRRAGLRAVPAVAAIERAATAARAAGAEWVVGLLHLGQAGGEAVLSALPEGTVDFAVVAHDRVATELRVMADGRGAYVQPGERGKWLVAVEATLMRGATRSVDVGAVAEQTAQLKTLESQIAAASQDPAKQRRLHKRKDQLSAQLAAFDPGRRHRLASTLIELPTDAPEDPGLVALYRRYQSDLTRLADVGVARAELKYVGNERCAECHAPAMRHWRTTGHAKAWQTMVRTRQTANLDCITCHVTGFERPGGPRRIADLARFRDVGCESCHGPGSAHAAEPKTTMDYGAEVPEPVCAECHRAQADQKPFVYEERLPRVIGRGHRVERASTD